MSDDVKQRGEEQPKKPPRGSPLRRRPPLGARNKNGNRSIVLTHEQIESALRATGGVMAHAADKLKVSRDVLYGRVRASQKLQKMVEAVRDREIDQDEFYLRKIRHNPKHKDHFKALQFYLKAVGRKRGYGDTLEVSAPPDTTVQWVLPQKRSLDEDPESAEPSAEPVDDVRREEETADSES